MTLPDQAVPLLYPVLAIIGAAIGVVVAIVVTGVKGFAWLDGKFDAKQETLLDSKKFRTVVREESIEALKSDEAKVLSAEASRLALAPHAADLAELRSKVDEANKTATAAHRRLDEHIELRHARSGR